MAREKFDTRSILRAVIIVDIFFGLMLTCELCHSKATINGVIDTRSNINSALNTKKAQRIQIDLLEEQKPTIMYRKLAIDELKLKPQLRNTISRHSLKEFELLSGNDTRKLSDSDYKCAKYCTCSIIQVLNNQESVYSRANLTQAKCEDPRFSDLLTIDRRSQIIHISLLNSDKQDDSNSYQQQHKQSFRMPRLNQFNILRELVIVNLRFQVCDSEVFKRGSKLRRLVLNYNQLTRISKSCLRHLDRLIELNIDHNELSELESALFSSLLNLKMLSIGHNKLVDLTAHQFANLTQLISLNLVGNLFKVINLHLFEPMQNSLRLLILAKNQIKSFIHQAPITQIAITKTTSPQFSAKMFAQKPIENNTKHLNIKTSIDSNLNILTQSNTKNQLFSGVVFKNLIKLNVDFNRIERIKLLQLHRFFNVKFLSIRHNNIATIRDKAFNGLKLVELNLANNKLTDISKCSFCNATIKRLVLANNNISLPQPNMLLDTSSLQTNQNRFSSASLTLATNEHNSNLDNQVTGASSESSQNVLILSQSIFGPLFSQLEYLDVSNNDQLANQLDLIIEPLLKLKFLNIANCGLDRSLPTPDLFKNLHHLKYLNISHNQLDQLVAETIEPLTSLQVIDLSYNKFSELDEFFLVTLDDLTDLKVINLASNPWFCSQCKVAPLYDWILRSPIYNSTCIESRANVEEISELSKISKLNSDTDSMPDEIGTNAFNDLQAGDDNEDDTSESSTEKVIDSSVQMKGSDSPVSYRTSLLNAGQPRQDYNLLIGDEDKVPILPTLTDLDFDLIVGDDYVNKDAIVSDDVHTSAASGYTNYNIYPSYKKSPNNEGAFEKTPSDNVLFASLATSEDDSSIDYVMAITLGSKIPETEYCLRCEFPSELKEFDLHDLSPGDFKYCAGSAPRFLASEPKIGLTLAIVIIGALFCVIIVVIFMYRKKSNAYYPNEYDNDQQISSGAKKQPVFSISSDAEHQYGDATDYSSPPMSQSFESFSGSQSAEDQQEDEEFDDEDEEYEEEDEEVVDEDYDTREDDDKTSSTGAVLARKKSNERSYGRQNSNQTQVKKPIDDIELETSILTQARDEPADVRNTTTKQIIPKLPSSSTRSSSLMSSDDGQNVVNTKQVDSQLRRQDSNNMKLNSSSVGWTGGNQPVSNLRNTKVRIDSGASGGETSHSGSARQTQTRISELTNSDAFKSPSTRNTGDSRTSNSTSSSPRSAHRRTAMKSVRTVDQTSSAATLKSTHEKPGIKSMDIQEMGSYRQEISPTSGEDLEMRPSGVAIGGNSTHLGRQRFAAFGKPNSGGLSRHQVGVTVEAGTPNSSEQVAPRDWGLMSPAMSNADEGDATSADSLALEYLAESDDFEGGDAVRLSATHESGAALEIAESPSNFDAHLSSDGQVLGQQLDPLVVEGDKPTTMRASVSTHSALTQTSRSEQED